MQNKHEEQKIDSPIINYGRYRPYRDIFIKIPKEVPTRSIVYFTQGFSSFEDIFFNGVTKFIKIRAVGECSPVAHFSLRGSLDNKSEGFPASGAN